MKFSLPHKSVLFRCVLLSAIFLFSFLPAGVSREAGPARADTGTINFQRSIDSNAIRDFSKPKSFWSKLLTWVAGSAEIETLGRPYALTEDNLGRLLVADPERRVVHILDFERRRYDTLTGSKRENFLAPVGVAVDSGNNIYVSDSARAQIYIFDKKGKFRRTLSSNKEGGRFLRPTGIALDAKRNLLYVTDTLRHQVLVLNTEGKLLRAIGRRGKGPAEFNFPTAVAIGQDGLYVLDAMNFRVQVLTPEGEFVRQLGRQGNQTGTFFRPKGIALDSQGNLYVVDALFETVQVFDPQGQLLTYFGSGGAGEGKFSLPSGIYITPRDQIFVADSLNRRVQVFRLRRKEP